MPKVTGKLKAKPKGKGPIGDEATAHALARRIQRLEGRTPGVIDYKDGTFGLVGGVPWGMLPGRRPAQADDEEDE